MSSFTLFNCWYSSSSTQTFCLSWNWSPTYARKLEIHVNRIPDMSIYNVKTYTNYLLTQCFWSKYAKGRLTRLVLASLLKQLKRLQTYYKWLSNIMRMFYCTYLISFFLSSIYVRISCIFRLNDSINDVYSHIILFYEAIFVISSAVLYILFLFDIGRALAFMPLLTITFMEYFLISYISALIKDSFERVGD